MADKSGTEHSFKEGDRVWLLPDYDRREVKAKTPAIVLKIILSSGRIKVRYMEHRCNLSKTVDIKRVRERISPAVELGEKPLVSLKEQA